jgi:hypothetical protein
MQYKLWLKNLWNSFPIQLLILHFKKHQLILIYWVLLFATITGHFMNMFGANSLFLAPEYVGTVNFLSTFFVGIAFGVFVMSWNITTFILFSRHFKFLATAEKPFLVYCLNNFLIPLFFIVTYAYKLFMYGLYKELFDWSKVLILLFGFIVGTATLILISFLYFFRADKSITKRVLSKYNQTLDVNDKNINDVIATSESNLIKVKTYLSSIRKTSIVREVKHYNKAFLEKIFSTHHLAGIFLILFAFFTIIGLSFFLDNIHFELPAAASIITFFALLLALFGALAYFLQNWSLPFTILLFFILNILFQHRIIDPTNKAYGLNYNTTKAIYDSATLNKLCAEQQVYADSLQMIQILNNWKAKQGTDKPTFYLLNVSGGGSRSATFTMHIMRQLDSLLQNQLMRKTFLITGASGGMLGAAYYRALHTQQLNGTVKDKNNLNYVNDIGNDLLNPIFTSLVARDIISPIHKFKWQNQYYIKDRGYAFEQKLNQYTHGYLQKPIEDLKQQEQIANIPLIFYSAAVLRDGRKLITSPQPISFLMKPSSAAPVDAIDFGALFKNQNGNHLNQLTALRMNASFPYVLPTVALPTQPTIDVMDAGVRDNFGQDIATRFLLKFKDWLDQNVKQVVIVGIRDRPEGNWDMPFDANDMSSILTKPVAQMQYNLFKIQDYNQIEQLNTVKKVFNVPIQKISFCYVPSKKDGGAALSFHLTQREKKLIAQSLWNEQNTRGFLTMKELNK